MRFLRIQNAVLAMSFIALAGFVANTLAPVAHAQTNTSGDIVGIVAGTPLRASGTPTDTATRSPASNYPRR